MLKCAMVCGPTSYGMTIMEQTCIILYTNIDTHNHYGNILSITIFANRSNTNRGITYTMIRNDNVLCSTCS